MRGLFLYSFVLVGSLASLPAAKADTFTTYVFSSVNPWFPYGMDAPGDVVLDNTPSNPVTYEIWNAGVLLSTTSTLPAGFVADDGAACALPSVPDAFGPAVCNGSREVYAINNGTPDNLVYEIYPGSPPDGQLAASGVPYNGGPVYLNSVGDIFYVDGRDEVYREVIDTPATPEPGSFVLLGTGLAGMTAALRRRRRGGIGDC
jgi:hypothetical protein